MDVSPVQRQALTANHAAPPVAPALPAPVAATAQGRPAAADQQATRPRPEMEASTSVVVAWNAASLGYVTRVVDQHTGAVVLQTPPEQVLKMVEMFIERLEGGHA